MFGLENELVKIIRDIAKKYPTHTMNVGIRCNFDVGDGVTSRFGFDIESEAFKKAICLVNNYENIYCN